MLGLKFGFFGVTPVFAEQPTQEDVNIYASLCKTGSLSAFDVNAEAGLFGRRLLSGEVKLSAEKLKDEFPGIKDEKNRVILIQGLQDCMYRYVERFHPPKVDPKADAAKTPAQLDPSIPPERRKEIVYLANQIEDFKKIMSSAKEVIPERVYDKNDSTEKFPKKDTNLIDLENYSRYKAFQTPSGIPDFSDLAKSDVAIICDTFENEVNSFYKFRMAWYQITTVPPEYNLSQKVQEICAAAKR